MAHCPPTQTDSDDDYSDMLRCMVQMFHHEKERLPAPTPSVGKRNDRASPAGQIENIHASGASKANTVSSRSGKSPGDQHEYHNVEAARSDSKQHDASPKKTKIFANPVQGAPTKVTSSKGKKDSTSDKRSSKRAPTPEANSSGNKAREINAGFTRADINGGETLALVLPRIAAVDPVEYKKLEETLQRSLEKAFVKGVPVLYTVPVMPVYSGSEQEKDSFFRRESEVNSQNEAKTREIHSNPGINNPPEDKPCSCPPVSYAQLTFGVANAAREGRTKEVLRWLKEGGDINASDANNRTLLHLAIANQEVHLVKKLLRQPNIHLNQGCHNTVNMVKGNTPLDLAINLCSEDCVKALLSSPSQCKVSLDGKSYLLKMAVRHAIQKRWWMILQMLIKAGLMLQKNETSHLSVMAVNSKEMGILKLIIENDFPLDGSLPEIDRMLVELYDQGMWDYVGADKLFKAAIRASNYISLRVVKRVMQDGNVPLAERLLRMLFPDVTIHVGLAEAIIEKDLDKIVEIMNKTKMSGDQYTGTLFMSVVCNSTEAIIETLLDAYSYPKEVIDYVLIFAAVNDHFNFYHLLFKRYSFSYSVLLSAHRIASKQAITIIGSVLENVEQQVVFDNGVISGKKEAKQSQSSNDYYN